MIERFDIEDGAGFSCDLHEVTDTDGEYVSYEDCKALCNEAAQVITDLCDSYGHPKPEATLARLGL